MLKILTIANKTEEKFLRARAPDFNFSKFSKKEINEFIKKMKETMLKVNGIGLAANQVGWNFNFFVAQIPQFENDKIVSQKFYAIFNPKIESAAWRIKKTAIEEEGCLSVPGIAGFVERREKITLVGFDKNGRTIKIKAEGLIARVFQHEVDHLNGILFIDKCASS